MKFVVNDCRDNKGLTASIYDSIADVTNFLIANNIQRGWDYIMTSLMDAEHNHIAGCVIDIMPFQIITIPDGNQNLKDTDTESRFPVGTIIQLDGDVCATQDTFTPGQIGIVTCVCDYGRLIVNIDSKLVNVFEKYHDFSVLSRRDMPKTIWMLRYVKTYIETFEGLDSMAIELFSSRANAEKALMKRVNDTDGTHFSDFNAMKDYFVKRAENHEPTWSFRIEEKPVDNRRKDDDACLQ